jgi:succinyl-CoA synthetase alpha subunit
LNSADSLEITTDIENRIAEMFNEILLKEGKQVVVVQDVKTVVEQMGSVEDFETVEEGAKTHAQRMHLLTVPNHAAFSATRMTTWLPVYALASPTTLILTRYGSVYYLP